MKAALAALLIVSGAVPSVVSAAKAESSYWEEHSREPARLGYRADGPRDHVDVRIQKRPRGYGRSGYAPRSYNGPVYQTQEQVQQSLYDFSTGGAGDINAYR